MKDDQDKEILFQNIIKGLLIMKHKGFEEEKEVRRVYFEREGLHFRNKEGMTIPYVKISIELSNICAIWVGPGENIKQRRKGMEIYLSALKNSGVFSGEPPAVKTSRIPLR